MLFFVDEKTFKADVYVSFSHFDLSKVFVIARYDKCSSYDYYDYVMIERDFSSYEKYLHGKYSLPP
jgi:folate-dependent tRNA-U54 methylase TrmFO/GidA